MAARHASMYETPEGTRRLSSSTAKPSCVRTTSVPPHGNVGVVGNREAPHLDPVLGAAQHQVGGHDSVAQRPSFVVDVLQKEVERGQALPEAAVDVVPFLRREQAGNAVDGDDLLGRPVRADDRERDPLVDEPARDAFLQLPQFLRRGARQRRAQPPRDAAEASVSAEHLVVEAGVQLVARERPRSGLAGPRDVGVAAVERRRIPGGGQGFTAPGYSSR